MVKCRNFDMFPSRKEVKSKRGEVDHTILDFYRTETAFAIIALILMLMGHGFSFYTFIEQRYMYKRLASGVHFLTAATVLVVVEVLKNAAHYATAKLQVRHPVGSDWHFGFSYGLAWISFISFVSAGLAFLILSRKRKGRRAINELHATADEPHILGRV
uniref:MARVEL domain-containing protein n=1 Tax=Strigamia maritima TaxID=126957 RepID=T1JP77_STRMM